MIEQINITDVLFLDIETVPAHASYSDLDDNWKYLWDIKARQILKKSESDMEDGDAASVYDRAGIYAEFGKIICISVGLLFKDKEDGLLKVRLKSYADDDEKKLLTNFSILLNKSFSNPNQKYLCGHNIKEFDIPYICRRLLMNQMPLPKLLDLWGKKPWESKHLLDTLELWKFGDNKNYTSLKLLAAALGFPSPKDDIDGSEVCGVYWVEKNLPRISTYCEKDVLAVVQLLLRLRREAILEENQIIFVN